MIDKRMMYAQGKRVGGIMGSNAGSMLVTPTRDGSRPGYYGPDAGHENDPGHGSNSDNGNNNGNGGSDRDHSRFDEGSGYYGGPTTTAPDTSENDGPQNQIPKPKPKPPTPPNFSIHVGPTYKAPPRVPDQIGFSTFNTVPNVTYNTGLETQRLKNIQLQNELKDYKPKSLFPGFLNIFNLGTPANINFFNKNSIGAKINPETGQPFGYGIDGFKAYMEQRSLGNVGAYGGTELSQNAINAGSGGDNGIMDVYNAPNYTNDGDADGDGDVDQDDFIFRYFDKTGETLQAGAGGVQDLMTQIRKRISNIFS